MFVGGTSFSDAYGQSSINFDTQNDDAVVASESESSSLVFDHEPSSLITSAPELSTSITSSVLIHVEDLPVSSVCVVKMTLAQASKKIKEKEVFAGGSCPSKNKGIFPSPNFDDDF